MIAKKSVEIADILIIMDLDNHSQEKYDEFRNKKWLCVDDVRKVLDDITYNLHHTVKYTCWEEAVDDAYDILGLEGE